MSNVCCQCGLDQILENTLHPGGLKLTKRLGEMSGLEPGHRVLEIGCGKGMTSIFLAKQYGSSITGVDISSNQVTLAKDSAKKEGWCEKTSFVTADFQELPFPSHSFEVVFSECSISLASDKRRLFGEIWRVLKPGGRLIMSDLMSRDGEVAKDPEQTAPLSSPSFPSLPCIKNSESIDGYVKLLKRAGFQNLYTEDSSGALKEAFFRMRLRFGSMDELLKEIACNCTDCGDMMRRKTGYALIRATKD